MQKPIQKLLVANRGEIACRIFRTASALGISTVAVYSDADREALHVKMADEALHIGKAEAHDSYLNSAKIIAAAQSIGADAIHPGYGFLSENAAFAAACEKAGIIFVGPSAAAIEAMGSKSHSKALIEQAGVPVLPGYHGDDQSLPCFQEQAERCGYPILLKASAGGGGKGMRIVDKAADLEAAIASAKREAEKSFGDDRLLLEKLLLNPRHVEVQIFGDKGGNRLYLSERDCSIQRRHQKIVEEAPAPGLSSALRRQLGEAALKVARAIHYVGAGTIEFLLAEDGQFYFMEMNTRLQVEHPVTEMINGFDLVEWQLRIASGENLPVKQSDIAIRGHAIEVRICAEDATNDFLPATGIIESLRIPTLDSTLRLDSGIQTGDDVGVFYDPLLAKLIAWGTDRAEAQRRLIKALEDTFIAGLITNLSFLRQVISHPAFVKAELNTHFLQQHAISAKPGNDDATMAFAVAAICLYRELCKQRERDALQSTDSNSPWWTLDGWRHTRRAPLNFVLRQNEDRRIVTLTTLAKDCFQIHIDDQELRIDISGDDESLLIHADSGKTRWFAAHSQESIWLQDQRFCYRVENETGKTELLQQNDKDKNNLLLAPMTGTVVSIAVKAGSQVDAGDVLLTVEAMKMEHSLRATHKGRIAELYCEAGQLVQGKQQLLRIE